MKIARPRDFGWIAVFLFALAMFSSSAFQECVHSTNPSYQQEDGGPSLFSIVAYVLDWSRLTCVGSFVHHAKEEILAAFTILLAFFTLSLWAATNRLAEEAKEASEKSRVLAEETAKRQLRAYLSVDAAELRDLAVDLKPEGQIRIKNSGATPAYDVTTLITLTAVKDPLELAEYLKRAVPVGPSQIGPGGTLSPTSVIDMAMTQTLLNTLTTKSHTLYLHGRIDYTDIFRKPHWTTFRCAQDPDRIGTARLRICSEGNDADRD